LNHMYSGMLNNSSCELNMNKTLDDPDDSHENKKIVRSLE
jgi:hypothetical protein